MQYKYALGMHFTVGKVGKKLGKLKVVDQTWNVG